MGHLTSYQQGNEFNQDIALQQFHRATFLMIEKPEKRPWPILVISLADQCIRRNTLISQLETFRLEFQLATTVDGRNGLSTKYESMIDRSRTLLRLRRPMSDGEYGCAISHMLIYRRIVDEGLPGAIVLEDDARLHHLFCHFVGSRGYERAHIVLLDHANAWVWRSRSSPLMPGVDGFRLALNPKATTGYSISARGARYILRNGFPICSPADWPCDISRISSLAALPHLERHPI